MLFKCSPSDFLALLLCPLYEPKDWHEGIQPENHGSVFHEEGRILANLATVLGGDCLEIGTNLGISTRYIAEGLEQLLSGEVHTIDIDPRADFREASSRIIRYHLNSKDFKCRPFKWAFIDGDHKYHGVVQDIEIARECGCSYILFHDTNPIQEKQQISFARSAALDNFDQKEWELFDITTHCGMIYARRRSNV